MEEIQWIKLYVDMFDNKKIKFIRKLPEGGDILLCWIMLLVNAGRCNANGYIFLTEQIPYTAEMLSDEYGLPLSTIKLALETFKKLEMIEIDIEGIFILNWAEYQNIEGMEKVREQTRLRVERYRSKRIESKDKKSNVTGSVTVTESNGTELELDLDKDIDKNIKGKQAKELLDYFFQKYQAKFGMKMPVNGAKDINLFKKALETIELEKIKKCIDLFFESADPFIQSTGYTIGVFHSQASKLLIQSNGINPQNQAKEYSHNITQASLAKRR